MAIPKFFDLAESGDESAQFEFRQYCRYLVGLAAVAVRLDENGGPADSYRPFFRSGFVVSLDDDWYLATAGHVLEGIERERLSGKAHFEQFRLIDIYGVGNCSEPVPFDYEGAFKSYRHDRSAGLDVGIIRLDPYYRKLLEANEIIAITQDHWTDSRTAQCDCHFILGLPEDTVDRAFGQGTVHGKAVPSMVLVNRTEEIPSDLSETEYPRFIGQIDESHEIGNIDGMSGGPIFGVNTVDGHEWIVAVQSSWFEGKFTIGCPLSVFMGIVDEQVHHA